MAKAQIQATFYSKFRGVDFSTDPSLVSDSRSPLAVNMLADVGGRPEKRTGWRTLFTLGGEEEARVNGLYAGTIGGQERFLAHVGTKLYGWELGGEPQLLTEGLRDAPGAGAYFGGKLWILAGKYLVYDGESVQDIAREGGYAPLTTITRSPSGGGVAYEDLNLVSPWRRNSFQTDGSTRTFQLDTDKLDLHMTATASFPNYTTDKIMIYGSEESNYKYGWFQTSKIYPAGTKLSFDWEKKKVTIGEDEVTISFAAYSTAYNTIALSGRASVDSDCAVTATVWGEAAEISSVNYYTGAVTLKSAPAAPSAGSADGLELHFRKTVAGYAERIGNCSILAAYGVGTNDRLVFSGNQDYPNQDWTSALGDPTYVPDLSYAAVGLEGVPIMGYARVGDSLAIIKADNGQDSTVFMRSASLADGEAVFPLRQSVAGVGAIAARSVASILDEPLFLASTGIFALTSNVVTSEKICQNRSFYVDASLTNEPGLADAAAVSYKGMYLLAVNSHVYVLDGRQEKTYRSESLGDYVYECFYLEDVPAVCWLNHKCGAEESLYFGTADGRICRFNTDINDMSRYADDGAPIVAMWATKADDDGDPTRLKTMIKKGGAVTLKPYTRSSAKVSFRTDQDASFAMQVRGEVSDTMDIFDWEDIDFSRFTFNANDGPQEIVFNTKIKKYKRLQILVRNDAANEGFGVYKISKHYVTGNFSKR